MAAIILIEDPIRENAIDVVKSLRSRGFSDIVMMTGDSERTAKRIAKLVDMDSYYAEVLPEDKTKFVEEKKKEGE